MTENKRFKLKYINEQHISANLYDNKTFIGSIGMGEELIVELLNDLSGENEQLKKILNELSDMLQFDVENEIKSYPMKLSEYLSNALKELQE